MGNPKWLEEDVRTASQIHPDGAKTVKGALLVLKEAQAMLNRAHAYIDRFHARYRDVTPSKFAHEVEIELGSQEPPKED